MAITVVLRKKLGPGELETVVRAFDIDSDGSIGIHEVELIAHTLSRASRELITSSDSFKTLRKPAQLSQATSDLTDEQIALFGSMLEEYRDKIREQKEVLDMEKRMEQEHREKTNAEIAKARAEAAETQEAVKKATEKVTEDSAGKDKALLREDKGSKGRAAP